MASVDLIIAQTVSPTLSFISSALRRVMMLSIKCSPTLTTVSHHPTELEFLNLSFETIAR